MEAASEDEDAKKRWYDLHDVKNNREHAAELDLLKSAALYTEAKYASRVADHFYLALSAESPKQYLFQGIDQRFIPEP
eukprot:14102306-Ditylum_brightwellii.AAC.1